MASQKTLSLIDFLCKKTVSGLRYKQTKNQIYIQKNFLELFFFSD